MNPPAWQGGGTPCHYLFLKEGNCSFWLSVRAFYHNFRSTARFSDPAPKQEPPRSGCWRRVLPTTQLGLSIHPAAPLPSRAALLCGPLPKRGRKRGVAKSPPQGGRPRTRSRPSGGHPYSGVATATWREKLFGARPSAFPGARRAVLPVPPRALVLNK